MKMPLVAAQQVNLGEHLKAQLFWMVQPLPFWPRKHPEKHFGASRSGPGNMDFLAPRPVHLSPASLHILGPLVEENPLVDAPLSIGGGSRSFNLQYFQNLLPARPTQDEFARHVEDL